MNKKEADLVTAVENNDLRKVNILLAKGVASDGLALRTAAQRGNLPLVELLLERGRSMSYGGPTRPHTNNHGRRATFGGRETTSDGRLDLAALDAAIYGHLDVLSYLIMQGADPDDLLIYSVRSWLDPMILDYLLTFHPRQSVLNQALSEAINWGRYQNSELLRGAGADIEAL